MTTRCRLQLTLATALLAAASSSHAQTWQMILPSPVPGAAPLNLGRDVLLNPFSSSPEPGIFLATEKSSLDGSVVSSIFRLTPTDSTSDHFTFEAVDGALTGASRLAYNPGSGSGGGLYAAGFTVTITGSKGKTTSLQTWKVRRSPEADQGDSGTWDEDDSFNFATVTKGKTTTYDARAHGITTDDLGNLYVCGRAMSGQGYRWIVRKKSGGAWNNVLDMTTGDGHSIPYDVCFVPQVGNNLAPALFVAGLFNNRWTVLRSVNRGGVWEPVGPWPDDGSLASAWDVASDSSGNIYVVGVRGRDGANKGWVVRRSSDGGNVWTTLLDKPSDPDSYSWAARLSIDAQDNIAVAGAIHNGLSQPIWTVVRNSPNQPWTDSPTASWETRVIPPGLDTPSMSKGRGMVSDASGNMFLTGDVVNWTDPADGTYYSGPRVGLLRMVP